MCLITFAYKIHPRYRLILAANRDEFYQRPTAPADFWAEQPAILAGRDLQAGGTWMGLSANGRFAAITNYREGSISPAPLSRGNLVLDFLSDHCSAASFTTRIEAEKNHYNGYNLLIDDGDNIAYCSNRHPHTTILSAGVYGLSNHLLNTPWPKVSLANHHLQQLIKNDSLSTAQLLTAVASKTLFDDELLPSTGIDPQLERALSAPFVDLDSYGTRCSTALLMDYAGNIEFLEQSFLHGKETGPATQFNFST